MITQVAKNVTRLCQPLQYNSSSETGAIFLTMVENFFDRAALHTGIRADRLNFYKKAESVLKCSIPLIRGKTI